MAEEMDVGCARPTGGPVGEPAEENTKEETKPIKETIQMIHVGEKVPDFVAPISMDVRPVMLITAFMVTRFPINAGL